MADYLLKEKRVYLREGVSLYSDTPIDNPRRAANLIGKEILAKMDREYLVVVNMDTKLRPISYHIATIGSQSETIADIPSIFKAALLENATSIILLHNHPSGDPTPSNEDCNVTKRVRSAGELLGITLLDHIIIGAGDDPAIYSFLENGWNLGEEENFSVVGEKRSPYRSSRDDLKDITNKLEEGVKEVFSSDRYRQYLDVMSRFYSYSFNNCLLIAMQKPDATLVAGYQSWQKNFDRQVMHGEKAIKIIQPCPYRKIIETVSKDEYGNTILNVDGTPKTEIIEKNMMSFKVGSVFDISQTDGKCLPEITLKLSGNVEEYDHIMTALTSISPVPVCFGETGSANGYYNDSTKQIVLKDGMSQEQTVKTCIHEIAHSIMHSKESSKETPADRHTKEVQAESVAYVVCQRLGIETSQYSFGYVAGWSSGKSTKELQDSLDIIQKTSANILDRITDELSLLDKETEAISATVSKKGTAIHL